MFPQTNEETMSKDIKFCARWQNYKKSAGKFILSAEIIRYVRMIYSNTILSPFTSARISGFLPMRPEMSSVARVLRICFCITRFTGRAPN